MHSTAEMRPAAIASAKRALQRAQRPVGLLALDREADRVLGGGLGDHHDVAGGVADGGEDRGGHAGDADLKVGEEERGRERREREKRKEVSFFFFFLSSSVVVVFARVASLSRSQGTQKKKKREN